MTPSTTDTTREQQQQQQQQQSAGRAASARRSALVVEIVALWRLGYPIVITLLGQVLQSMVCLLFVGRLVGHTELAAAGIGAMFVNITGFSVGFGLCTALDTLCSQEFGRDRESRQACVHLQRGLCILAILSVPVAALWLFADRILAALVVPELAALGGDWVRGALPGLLPSYVFEAMKKYLQARGVTKPNMVICLATTSALPLVVWALVSVGGFHGARFTMSITCWVQAVALVWWAVRANLFTCGVVPIRELLRGWGSWLRLGIPGMLMLMGDWCTFEVLTLFAGKLGTVPAAAHITVVNLLGLIFMAPLAISCACTTRLGNALGAGREEGARLAAKAAYAVAGAIVLVDGLLLVAARRRVPLLFTTEPDVVEQAARLLPIVAVFHLLDVIQIINGGITRAIGLQGRGWWCYMISYFLVALPVAAVFAFRFGWGVEGLWYATVIGGVLLTFLTSAVILLSPWRATGLLLSEEGTPMVAIAGAMSDDEAGLRCLIAPRSGLEEEDDVTETPDEDRIFPVVAKPSLAATGTATAVEGQGQAVAVIAVVVQDAQGAQN